MDGEKLPNPSAHHDPKWEHEGDLNNAESSSANHTGTETPVYDEFLEKDSAFNNDDDHDHHVHNQVDTCIEDEKPQDAAPADETTADTQNQEYISGFKLYGVVLSVTLACFLILLDMSIIATVLQSLFFPPMLHRLMKRSALTGYPADHESISFPSRCRLVREFLSTYCVSFVFTEWSHRKQKKRSPF
jgi:hypothetical protein